MTTSAAPADCGGGDGGEGAAPWTEEEERQEEEGRAQRGRRRLAPPRRRRLAGRRRLLPSATISFSHFVPRVELTPEKRFLFVPTLAKVRQRPGEDGSNDEGFGKGYSSAM